MKKIKQFTLSLLMCISIIGYAQLQIGETIELTDTDFAYAASVSTSANGERIAISGYGKSEFGFRVYDYDGTLWNQVGEDIPADNPDTISTYKIELSADGKMIVTSTIIDRVGLVRVYEFQNNQWLQVGSTIYGESNLDIFGLVIAISADGQRISSGAKFNNNFAGHARVYEYDGVDWIQIGSDIDGDESGDYYGTSLSMSSDGNRVAVGANQYSPGGLLRVFEFDGIDWIQLGSDLISGEPYDNFGVSSSLSQDGNRIIIGDFQNLGYEGYVEVYDFNGVSWNLIGTRIVGSEIQDGFGRIVSISDDGNRITVGAPSVNNSQNTNKPGYVKVYELNNGNWHQLGATIFGDEIRDQFGAWNSISADGSTLISGALKYTFDQSGTEEGYAKVYNLNTILDITDIGKTKFIIYPNPSSDYISVSNSDLIKQIEIYNSLGQKIKIDNFSENRINVTGFSDGIYFIQLITTENQIFNQKFIKN